MEDESRLKEPRKVKEAKPQSSPTRMEIIMLKINRFMTILTCLTLIASFAGCASTSKQESTGQYIDNSVITTKVKTAIFKEPSLKSLQIDVKSFKGEVQLSGFVDSVQSVTKAGEVARGVEGVVMVKNDLVVK